MKSEFENEGGKSISIPRRLLLLVGLASAVTVAATALYYFTSTQIFKTSSALTTDTVAKLGRSYDLLQRIGNDMNGLQQLLRLNDPDEIEKAIKDLETSEKQSLDLIASCAEHGSGVKAKFDKLMVLKKDVVAELLTGQSGLAYEKYLQKFSPQGSAVLDEVRKYHEGVQVAAQAELQTQQARMQVQLRWRLSILVALLAVSLVAGWRLKNRIARELMTIAFDLSKVSEASANASAQVSDSSQSLAEGSSEQAASVEETSASLEELSSMTKRNAENAHKANELAREARTAADKGAGDMTAMNTAMHSIKTSSDDIAKIIKTIDEIAFQTNILALNAAVEAARAGEAGMGFAVVADEVRSLAQRSATAAKETAAKIEGAITNTAQGVQISAKVTEALNDIVIKARQVDELVTEVASASREQTQGITQINSAVSQMDKVTQSNAANAEESAAAAEELNAQAEVMRRAIGNLMQLVGGSTAESHQAPTSAPPPTRPSGTRSQSPAAHKLVTPKAESRLEETPMGDDFKNF